MTLLSLKAYKIPFSPYTMGTRGYYVYRHNGRYFIYYNHYDSYPEGLGVEFLSGIPKNPEMFKRWLEEERHNLDEEYEQLKSLPESERMDGVIISEGQVFVRV